MKRLPSSHPQSSRRGSVLIVVLWISLALVAVAISFGSSMLMAYRGSDNDLAGRQAQEAINGALQYAQTILINSGTPGVLPDVSTYQSEAVQIGDATFWFIGRDIYTTPNTDTTPVYGLTDEAAKLNVNTATAQQLTLLPGMSSDLADSIVAWRDANGGADDGSYMAMQPPYISKLAPYESVEELGLVYNLSSLYLYGEDANLNGAVDPNEDDGDKNDPLDNSDGQLQPGILEYLTPFSREPNTQSSGAAKINVSTLTDDVIQQIQALNSNVGSKLGPAERTPVQFKSPLEFYSYCVSQKQILPADAAAIYDSVTTTTGPYSFGAVNVNTAQSDVLVALFGDQSIASAIVSTRQSHVNDGTCTWLVDSKVLTDDQVKTYGPQITGKSYQISVDIAAVGRNGRGFRRTLFVLDTSGSASSTSASASSTSSTGSTSTNPTVIYRRNLSHLGWALGTVARQNLAQKRNSL